jgi:hypothetical protein
MDSWVCGILRNDMVAKAWPFGYAWETLALGFVGVLESLDVAQSRDQTASPYVGETHGHLPGQGHDRLSDSSPSPFQGRISRAKTEPVDSRAHRVDTEPNHYSSRPWDYSICGDALVPSQCSGSDAVGGPPGRQSDENWDGILRKDVLDRGHQACNHAAACADALWSS